MRALTLIGLAALCASLLSPVPARAADDGVAQLQRFVTSTPQASGRFTQTLVKEGGALARPSSGTFAYARPGRFRWDIQKPYEQLIVTDGKQLYFYDKDLQQVTIKPVAEGLSTTPAALLFGGGDIDRAFTLVNEAANKEADKGAGKVASNTSKSVSNGASSGGAGDLAWVIATPRTGEAGFERLRIGMRGGQPARMEVIDAFGQQSRFEFDGIDPKASLGDDLFRFTPPPGVDVVQ